MKYSNDASLNARISAHRFKMAERIESIGAAISSMQMRGKPFAGQPLAGLNTQKASEVANWLRAGSSAAALRNPMERAR